MSYMLRDRPDGQFEIVLSRPILVGIFPEKDVAARVMFFLQEGEVEPVDDNAASFGQALRDAAAVEDETEIELLEEIEIVDPAPPPDAIACGRSEGCAADDRLQASDQSRVGDRLRAYLCRRETGRRGPGLWPEPWPVAISLGHAMSRDPAAPGGGRPSALQTMPHVLHAVDFAPRYLRAVQP